MDRQDLDRDDQAVVRLLTDSRPTPAPSFERELERRLIGSPKRRGRMPVLGGIATSAALAVVLFAAGVFGGGPLSPDGQSPVQADQDCRFVVERTRERVPFVDTDKSGKTQIRYRTETVSRRVKRCD